MTQQMTNNHWAGPSHVSSACFKWLCDVFSFPNVDYGRRNLIPASDPTCCMCYRQVWVVNRVVQKVVEVTEIETKNNGLPERRARFPNTWNPPITQQECTAGEKK